MMMMMMMVSVWFGLVWSGGGGGVIGVWWWGRCLLIYGCVSSFNVLFLVYSIQTTTYYHRLSFGWRRGLNWTPSIHTTRTGFRSRKSRPITLLVDRFCISFNITWSILSRIIVFLFQVFRSLWQIVFILCVWIFFLNNRGRGVILYIVWLRVFCFLVMVYVFSELKRAGYSGVDRDIW